MVAHGGLPLDGFAGVHAHAAEVREVGRHAASANERRDEGGRRLEIGVVGVGEAGRRLPADLRVLRETGAVDLESHFVELAVQELVA